MEIVEEPRLRGFCGFIFYRPSRDITRPLELPRGLKGMLHMPNTTVITYGSGTRRRDFVCGAAEKKNKELKCRGRRARAWGSVPAPFPVKELHFYSVLNCVVSQLSPEAQVYKILFRIKKQEAEKRKRQESESTRSPRRRRFSSTISSLYSSTLAILWLSVFGFVL